MSLRRTGQATLMASGSTGLTQNLGVVSPLPLASLVARFTGRVSPFGKKPAKRFKTADDHKEKTLQS